LMAEIGKAYGLERSASIEAIKRGQKKSSGIGGPGRVAQLSIRHLPLPWKTEDGANVTH
jgi:hypothetical protein